MNHQLPAEEATTLLATLKARFEKHPERHKGITWQQVLNRLEGTSRA
ncbi:MAG: DUF4256 family protein, partial [Chitinophagia bacterium]|nr:DUF4256 family protein [Chitinophagia bacterium]